MKRISNNRDLFEANAGEMITITVAASQTPYQGTFSGLESGEQWTSVQSPTPARPVEKRQFTMPAAAREFFDIVYSFPPVGQADANAKYLITFSGGGATDGPNDVLPPVAGDLDDLPYEFRLPGMLPAAAFRSKVTSATTQKGATTRKNKHRSLGNGKKS